VQGKLKSQLLEANEEMRRFQDDLEAQSRTLAMLELEKLDLMEVLYIVPERGHKLTTNPSRGCRIRFKNCLLRLDPDLDSEEQKGTFCKKT
jgi:hypothetical protein